MKTKIVTAIYDNLFGSDLGGRINRGGHYKYSLRSLLKMSDADFVCYTSEGEIDELKKFFYVDCNVSPEKLIIKTFDLRNFEFTEKINKIKNLVETQKSDRCVEIQYAKFVWVNNEITSDYDNIFWFDAGLSHTGLIPPKYMDETKGYWEKYYESSLFNNIFLNKLINHCDDKLFVCAKENVMNYWSGTVPEQYYTQHNMSHHIIGGFFGGKCGVVSNYCELFKQYTNQLLDNEPRLYHEENIMCLIFYNHSEIFNPKYFDIWWHEGERISGIDMEEYTKTRKSFYKVIEELN
jgi:hypothetical protein